MDQIQPDPFISVPFIRNEFKKLWNRPLANQEAAEWIIRISPPPYYHPFGLRLGTDSHVDLGMPPRMAVLQVHTHPRRLDPRPSTTDEKGGKGDWEVAIKTGLPVYVLSVWAIWKILPKPGEAVIQKVSDSWL